MALADSIKWVESWDTDTAITGIYSNLGSDGTLSITASGAHTGPRGVRIDRSSNRRLIVNDPRFTAGFSAVRIAGHYRWATAATNISDAGIYQLCEGTTIHLTIRRITGTGAIQVRRGGVNGTVLKTSVNGVLQIDVFSHLEVYAKIHDTAGEVIIRQNGGTTPILEVTPTTEGGNVDTRNGGTSGVINIWRLGEDVSPGTGPAICHHDNNWLQDATHVDADWVGDSQVVAHFPAATVANDMTVVGAATAHQAMDEQPPDGDTTYVSSSTVGHRVVVTPAAQSVAGTHITRQLQIVAKKNDSGAREVKILSTDGVDEDQSAAFVLATGYETPRVMLPAAPDGGAWSSVAGTTDMGVEITT